MSKRSVALRIPDETLPGDMLRVQTQAGLMEFPVGAAMKPGKKINVDIPVEADCPFPTLTVGYVQVVRDGRELDSSKRKITVAVPKAAKAGDKLTLHTEAGNFAAVVPPNVGKTLEVEVPPDVVAAGSGSARRSLAVTKLLLNGDDVASNKSTCGPPPAPPLFLLLHSAAPASCRFSLSPL